MKIVQICIDFMEQYGIIWYAKKRTHSLTHSLSSARQWFLSLLICLLVVVSVAYAGKEQPSNTAPTPRTLTGSLSENPERVTPTAVSGIPLKVHYIDVGQADCILIQIPNGKNVLIDAGNNNDGDTIVSYLKRQKVNKLDAVIATHPHADHIGGMATVINKFQISQVIMPPVTHTTKTFSNVISTIVKKDLKITEAKAGMSIDLGTEISAQIIAPTLTTYSNLNNYSVVIHLVYGATSFLFMGDAEDVSENEILKYGFNIKSDVLKVGHHGSKSSTGTRLLQKVHPSYAVISVGKNNTYGHPHPVTLQTLNNNKVKVFRTDESGTILIKSDGKDLSITTEK